jgi:hypothetical protein
MIQLCPFKEKEGNERKSSLGGQWKEKGKVPMLGGQWKEKEKVPFHLFPFSPKRLYLNLRVFPLISKFYFTMVLGCY